MNKYRIEEVLVSKICPLCEVPLIFEERTLSRVQLEERSKYYEKLSKNKFFTLFKIGLRYDNLTIRKAELMRCPKCHKLFHVEKEEESK